MNKSTDCVSSQTKKTSSSHSWLVSTYTKTGSPRKIYVCSDPRWCTEREGFLLHEGFTSTRIESNIGVFLSAPEITKDVDVWNKRDQHCVRRVSASSSTYTKARENVGDSRSRDGGGKETFEPRSQESPSNDG